MNDDAAADEVLALLPDTASIDQATAKAISYIPWAAQALTELIYRQRGAGALALKERLGPAGSVLAPIIKANISAIADPAREKQLLRLEEESRRKNTGPLLAPQFTIKEFLSQGAFIPARVGDRVGALDARIEGQRPRRVRTASVGINDGSMNMVVEFSTKRDVQLSYMASYSARGGYRQNSTDQSSQDELNKREKTLTYYSFEDAKFRGTLRLKVASAKGYNTAELVLAIR